MDAVRRWFLENDLLLNSDKSEAVEIGTAAQLKSVTAMRTVTVAGTLLPLSHELKSLSVTVDGHLRFDSHVGAVAKACTFHTRALCHVRHMLSTELAIAIGCSIVASRLDYCNSLLYGAPSMSLNRLQRSQDMLARVVMQSSSRTSARPLLQRYTGCQSESASTTKSPLWRSRLVGCPRRHT